MQMTTKKWMMTTSNQWQWEYNKISKPWQKTKKQCKQKQKWSNNDNK